MSDPASGIFSPVKLSVLDLPLFSVSVDLSADFARELERYGDEDDTSWEAPAQDALMYYRESFMTAYDHAGENIDWAIRSFGPPKPRLSLRRRNALAQILYDEIFQLRASGAAGNLILPQNSYQFVVRAVHCGEYASPTEVLRAAIPFLRPERSKSPRADFFDPACPPSPAEMIRSVRRFSVSVK